MLIDLRVINENENDYINKHSDAEIMVIPKEAMDNLQRISKVHPALSRIYIDANLAFSLLTKIAKIFHKAKMIEKDDCNGILQSIALLATTYQTIASRLVSCVEHGELKIVEPDKKLMQFLDDIAKEMEGKDSVD